MSWESLGQCLEYVTGEFRGKVTLPVIKGVVSCRCCPMISERRLDTYQCRMTGEWIISPTTTIGDQCPIEFKEVTK